MLYRFLRVGLCIALLHITASISRPPVLPEVTKNGNPVVPFIPPVLQCINNVPQLRDFIRGVTRVKYWIPDLGPLLGGYNIWKGEPRLVPIVSQCLHYMKDETTLLRDPTLPISEFYRMLGALNQIVQDNAINSDYKFLQAIIDGIDKDKVGAYSEKVDPKVFKQALYTYYDIVIDSPDQGRFVQENVATDTIIKSNPISSTDVLPAGTVNLGYVVDNFAFNREWREAYPVQKNGKTQHVDGYVNYVIHDLPDNLIIALDIHSELDHELAVPYEVTFTKQGKKKYSHDIPVLRDEHPSERVPYHLNSAIVEKKSPTDFASIVIEDGVVYVCDDEKVEKLEKSPYTGFVYHPYEEEMVPSLLLYQRATEEVAKETHVDSQTFQSNLQELYQSLHYLSRVVSHRTSS